MSSNIKYIFLGILCICLILCSTCVFAIDNATNGDNEESNPSSNMTVSTEEPVEIQPDNIIPEEHEVLPSDINFERFNKCTHDEMIREHVFPSDINLREPVFLIFEEIYFFLMKNRAGKYIDSIPKKFTTLLYVKNY